ncbi:MAG: hypothetical protein KR126chlam2_00577 [Chlamydiae bacterium]|nr:hypothetical protein [Chlamydiota bacterium]
MQAQVSGPTPEPPPPSGPSPSDSSKAAQSQSAGAAASSIASMIYRMVLIEFLGKWNAQLAAAATNANFLSGSVSFYNEIIKDLADFNLADSNLNFGSMFPKTSSGEYTGSAADASKKRDDEVSWAQKQKDQIAKDKTKIAEEQKKLKKEYDKHDGTITKQQYDKLNGQLNDLNTSLDKASADLSTLINDLNALKFTDDPKNKGQFTVSGGSMDAVAAAEKKATGDLTGIYNTITNDQTDYTTASTNAQMKMQLLLSQSGQIMSALSTIMSLLMQAESVVTQNIKG